MALPSAKEARPFYQSAWQRLADGQFLLDGRRNTAAVYLAGYAVECMLKALILSLVPRKKRREILDSFRGRKAHDFEWLKSLYLRNGGAALPPEVNEELSLVSTWTTDMRYQPGTLGKKEATDFLQSVDRTLEWAEGRL